jgi:hypothetical protein
VAFHCLPGVSCLEARSDGGRYRVEDVHVGGGSGAGERDLIADVDRALSIRGEGFTVPFGSLRSATFNALLPKLRAAVRTVRRGGGHRGTQRSSESRRAAVLFADPKKEPRYWSSVIAITLPND